MTPKSSGPALEECDRCTSFEADADTSLPRFATIKRWRVVCDSVLVGDHDHLLHVPVADDGVRRAIVRRSQLLCCRRIVMQSARVRSTNTDRSARAFRESLASKIQRQCAAIARRNIGRHRCRICGLGQRQPWRERPPGARLGSGSAHTRGAFTPRFTIDRQRTGGTLRRPSSARPMRSTGK
jgi:hypothetical protein